MKPAIFLSKQVVLFLVLSTLIVPVKAQDSPKELYEKIATLDSALFSVVYTCQNDKVARLIAEDFEFYHDKGGATLSKAKFLEDLTKNFCGSNGVKLRRELVKGSMDVFPMENFGAIQTGEHRFYRTENGQERLSGIARFTQLWKVIDGEWKLLRVLSYDHHDADSHSAAAQTKGTTETIYSDILKEKRTIQIVLPDDYMPENKYDVLYVLDGEGNTQLTRQIGKYVQEAGFMPQPIIVGVYNTDRNRDLTPTAVKETSSSGGAGNFLSFFERELIPYISKKYRIKSNGIFGHSFGGLFAMYALLTKPQVFDSYLVVDPSFWWDGGYTNKLAIEKLDPKLHSNKSLFISARGGMGSEEMKIPTMDSILKAKAIPGFQWKVVDYPGETHNSIRYKSIYDGLHFFYAGFNSGINYHPQNGLVQKNKPFTVWFFDRGETNLHYTTDGSEPTLASPLVPSKMEFPGPTQLTVKSFTPRGAFDKTIKADFRNGSLKPSPKPKNAVPGGFHYSYYEGSWDSLPDFKKLKPVMSGKINGSFKFDMFPRKENYACLFEGYIEIKEEGNYIFGLGSDDGSKLYLGNQLMFDLDGLHAMSDKSYVVTLEKGFYPLRLEYFQKGGGANLEFVYIPPSVKEPRPAQIPFEIQYSVQ
jgi:predicted alpha/beta superfamily hydrolase